MGNGVATRTAPAGLARRPRTVSRHLVARNLTAYLFLLPALVLFALFSWYPIVRGLVVSFQRVDLVRPPEWVGLANFRLLFDDPLFVRAWRNTVQFALLGLLIGYLVPFVLAVAVNEVRHLRG